MHRWLLGSLVALSTITNGAQPVDPHQPAQNAEIAMMRCFYGQAAALDDHISSAAVVAVGVVSACHPQIDDWKYAYSVEYHEGTEFRDRLERNAPNLATEVILQVRAASREPTQPH